VSSEVVIQSNFTALYPPLATRLEEKESEIKKEYNKVHERYTELLRSHCDLMERVKIMFNTDEALSANNLSSLSNLAGTLKSNLQKFGSNDDTSYSEAFNAINTNETSGSLSIYPERNSDNIVNSVPRQAWLETEMSYDDTTTIIEDVEELQRDKEKEARDRDHSLSGTFHFYPSNLSGYPNLMRYITNMQLHKQCHCSFACFLLFSPEHFFTYSRKENMFLHRNIRQTVIVCYTIKLFEFAFVCFMLLTRNLTNESLFEFFASLINQVTENFFGNNHCTLDCKFVKQFIFFRNGERDREPDHGKQ